MKTTTLLLILFVIHAAPASSYTLPCTFLQGPHRLFVGPEIYYTKRSKDGGSRQAGWLFGGRAEYERHPQYGLYYAVEGSLANGHIKGKTSAKKSLISNLTDCEIEGRLGVSYCFQSFKKLRITPFGGYGYFKTTNDFKKPSPLICTYHDSFTYGAAGIQVLLAPCNHWLWGLNLKAKFMIEGKSRVKDDPDFDDFTLIIDCKTQYEIDLPIRYEGCWNNRSITAVISPFYRLRHFGGMVNWPFDFIETKFQNFGAKFLLNIFF